MTAGALASELSYIFMYPEVSTLHYYTFKYIPNRYRQEM